jgi:hypothetical protein
MKQFAFVLALCLALLLSVACYHARIESGLPASTHVVEKSFAASWIYGLVPPSTVSAAKDCGKGVAVVETELSFLNFVVGALTAGIYTPMHIKVTCAASSSMGAVDAPSNNLVVPSDASEQEIAEAFALAADRAVASEQPVCVRFE